VVIVFGLGFAVKWLFVLAAILGVLWLFGFFASGPSTRWYRW
jgi:hypothetical protein